MRWELGIVRLTLRALGGRGDPYGDDVVARARELVERTHLTQREIAVRVGVSQITVSRWSRSGNWRRPPGAAKPVDETGASLRAMSRYNARTRPWRLLAEAETLLDSAARDGAELDGLERALRLLVEARAAHACGVGPKRR